MAPIRRSYHYPRALPQGSIRLLRLPVAGPSPVSIPIATATATGAGTGTLAPLVEQSQQMFSLEEYPCSPKLFYRALSYTWGPARERGSGDQAGLIDRSSDDEPASIILHGEEHNVTPNLYDALRQCSQTFPGTLLWVDALCINQDDLLERQAQVALMDQVYRNAQQVILWIGLANSETHRVLNLVRTVAKIDHVYIEYSRCFDHPRDFSAISADVAKAPVELWAEYLAFSERTWFQRGWVIQEATLARDALCLCGAETISWPDLVGGSRIFLKERMRKNFFAALKKRIPMTDIDSLPFGRNIWRMKLMQDACSDPNYRYLLVVGLCTGSYSLDSAEHILIHLMRMSRDFYWTDMRDKVYSVLGLVSYTAKRLGFPPLSLDPDYSPSVTTAHVLTKAAKAVIHRCNYVGIIAHVSDSSFRTLKGLPSWVPDFRKQYNFAMGHVSPINACGIVRRPDFDFSIVEDSLRVQGKLLGSLKRKQDISSLLHINWQILSSLIELATRATRPERLDRIDVLWRTMLWDIGSFEDEKELHPAAALLGDSFISWALLIRSLAQPCSSLEAFSDTNPSPSIRLSSSECCHSGHPTTTNDIANAPTTEKWHGSLTGSGQAYDYTMKTASGPFIGLASGPSWMQQLFLTDTGYLGMGPQSGQVSDEVWIVNGCPFPMVLRRNDNNFEVVGRCYVHGVMHGEALQDGIEWETLTLS